jgi:predicted ATP-grasp superfamily ATP-dependent carboligase
MELKNWIIGMVNWMAAMSAEELLVLRQSKMALMIEKTAVYLLALRRAKENGISSEELEVMKQKLVNDLGAQIKEWKERD